MRFAVFMILFGLALAAAPPALARTLHVSQEPACSAPTTASPIYVDTAESLAQTPRGPIGYYRFGHGSPILLITGFRATIEEWNAAFLDALARHHVVVVFDNRGIGRSLPGAKSFTLADMAADTEALIKTLGLRHLTLLGWSMGGSIAQQVAIDDPGLVGRMVLMGAIAPGPAGVAVPPDVLATLSGKSGVGLADILDLLFPAPVVPQELKCFTHAMYRPGGYGGAAISGAVTAGQTALLADWAKDEEAAAALAKLRLHTLILAGAADTVVSPKNAEVLRHLLPQSRLILVAHAGHAMMYQYPVALAETIGDFARP